jgi:hypothetical protein
MYFIYKYIINATTTAINAFDKDTNGISFKHRLKGHINWRKLRNLS